MKFDNKISIEDKIEILMNQQYDRGPYDGTKKPYEALSSEIMDAWMKSKSGQGKPIPQRLDAKSPDQTF
jgi:hypothetical protein